MSFTVLDHIILVLLLTGDICAGHGRLERLHHVLSVEVVEKSATKAIHWIISQY